MEVCSLLFMQSRFELFGLRCYKLYQCFRVGWSNLVDLGPTKRLIMINRRPGRLIEPGRPSGRPCISGYIPIYIPLYIYCIIHNKGSIKTALVFSW
jgi:hypothetical protein